MKGCARPIVIFVDEWRENERKGCNKNQKGQGGAIGQRFMI